MFAPNQKHLNLKIYTKPPNNLKQYSSRFLQCFNFYQYTSKIKIYILHMTENKTWSRIVYVLSLYTVYLELYINLSTFNF